MNPNINGTILNRLNSIDKILEFYKQREFMMNSGQEGYIKIATITIQKSYADSPLTFVISRRYRLVSTLTIIFGNCAHTNPNVDVFNCTNYPDDFYLHRKASDIGMWDLYVLKSEAYDGVCLERYFYDTYVNGNSLVDFSNSFFIEKSGLPSGGINPTKV